MTARDLAAAGVMVVIFVLCVIGLFVATPGFP